MRRAGVGFGVRRAPLIWVLVGVLALPAFLPHLALSAEATPVAAAPAAEAPQATSGPAAALASPPRSGIFVELRADDRKIRLYRHASAAGVSGLVCVAPCRKILARDATYVIRGEGMPATSAFSLPDDADEILLDVSAGSNKKRWIGGGVLSIGLLSVGSGLSELMSANGPQLEQGERDHRFEIGFFMVLGGIVSTVVGSLLMQTGQTSVISSTGATFTQRLAPPDATPGIALTSHGLVF